MLWSTGRGGKSACLTEVRWYRCMTAEASVYSRFHKACSAKSVALRGTVWGKAAWESIVKNVNDSATEQLPARKFCYPRKRPSSIHMET